MAAAGRTSTSEQLGARSTGPGIHDALGHRQVAMAQGWVLALDGRCTRPVSPMSGSHGPDEAAVAAARRDARDLLAGLVRDPDTTEDVRQSSC